MCKEEGTWQKFYELIGRKYIKKREEIPSSAGGYTIHLNRFPSNLYRIRNQIIEIDQVEFFIWINTHQKCFKCGLLGHDASYCEYLNVSPQQIGTSLIKIQRTNNKLTTKKTTSIINKSFWNCPNCNRKNRESDKRCPKCRCPKDTTNTWKCSCNIINLPNDFKCVKCWKKKDETAEGWICDLCKKWNFQSRVKCFFGACASNKYYPPNTQKKYSVVSKPNTNIGLDKPSPPLNTDIISNTDPNTLN